MEISNKYVQLKSIKGAPFQSGDTIVTPVSQVASLQTPFLDFVWNRPQEVEVQNGDEISTIQIVNVTRLAQFAIFGIGAVIAMLLLLINSKAS